MAEKILVVDDEISLQETLSYNLKKEGYQVEVAGDGISALELFRISKPDLVILDVMLPGMDGFEICRTMRQESNTPVLMMKSTALSVWKSVLMIIFPNPSACAS